ncbi:DUF4397 domain-containing protein [Steroidobacter sp. S1-65]|uniref:DUF4397 domain-containing protein n=1 Tax=Steroidobacter gossypii TaxID=2805490 RepID=A0ABS1X1L3_9GAMM|nr:DUF4397 domain-containing protein [Steroidobacter gossypii]MBM0107139.1 DUF4397 domain-containing protein [Steroidobacter gossypii]
MRYSLRLLGLLLSAAVGLSGCSSGGDSADANVRLLNVSTGYPALDLYVTEEDADTDALRSSNVVFGALGDYATVASGTYDIKFKRTGLSSTLRTAGEVQLADDSHVTYVAFGPVGPRFDVTAILEDVEEPEDNGRSKIALVNVAQAGGVDVFLTEPDVPLEDDSPMFPSGSGAMITEESGTYRLRVTGPNNISDLRLDVPSITLEENQVATLILTETTGGVLVDAILLPQQGAPITYKNTKARVRGAVGLLPGATATLTVGGVRLLNNRGVGVIDNYVDVEAGEVAVTLGVSGVPVSVPNQTLVAGNDYTMLLWNDASGVRVTLIADDNHQPTATDDMKIRLLNGFSTQSDPHHFSLAYAPVSEGTPVGQASSYAVDDGGADQRLDVQNTTTAATVATAAQPDVDLDAGSVYTLFLIADNNGNGITIVRKDR